MPHCVSMKPKNLPQSIGQGILWAGLVHAAGGLVI